MRPIGIVLLLLGFAVMNWKLIHARELQYSAVADQMQSMPQQEEYPRAHVWNSLAVVAHRTWNQAVPTMWLSGLAMLIGGLCLAFAPRAPKERKSPNQASEDIGAGTPNPQR